MGRAAAQCLTTLAALLLRLRGGMTAVLASSVLGMRGVCDVHDSAGRISAHEPCGAMAFQELLIVVHRMRAPVLGELLRGGPLKAKRHRQGGSKAMWLPRCEPEPATFFARAHRHLSAACPAVQAPEELLQGSSWKAKHHSQGASPAHAAPAVPAAPDERAEQRPSLPLETQAVTSGQMSDALANIGDLAAMYPDSQAQPAAPEQGTAPGYGPAEPQVSCCTWVPYLQRCEGCDVGPRRPGAAHASGRLPKIQVLKAELQERRCLSIQALRQILKGQASVDMTAHKTSKLLRQQGTSHSLMHAHCYRQDLRLLLSHSALHVKETARHQNMERCALQRAQVRPKLQTHPSSLLSR